MRKGTLSPEVHRQVGRSWESSKGLGLLAGAALVFSVATTGASGATLCDEQVGVWVDIQASARPQEYQPGVITTGYDGGEVTVCTGVNINLGDGSHNEVRYTPAADLTQPTYSYVQVVPTEDATEPLVLRINAAQVKIFCQYVFAPDEIEWTIPEGTTGASLIIHAGQPISLESVRECSNPGWWHNLKVTLKDPKPGPGPTVTFYTTEPMDITGDIQADGCGSWGGSGGRGGNITICATDRAASMGSCSSRGGTAAPAHVGTNLVWGSGGAGGGIKVSGAMASVQDTYTEGGINPDGQSGTAGRVDIRSLQGPDPDLEVTAEDFWTIMVFIAADERPKPGWLGLLTGSIEDDQKRGLLKWETARGLDEAGIDVVLQLDQHPGEPSLLREPPIPMLAPETAVQLGDTRRAFLTAGDGTKVRTAFAYVPNCPSTPDIPPGFFEVNTGTPAALAEFVNWACEKRPATSKALVLNGHAVGAGGLLHDDSSPLSGDADRLLMSEVGSAFAAMNPAARPSVVLANVCMGFCVELASELNGYSQYFVGSVLETEASQTQPDLWLNELASAPQQGSTALATLMYENLRSEGASMLPLNAMLDLNSALRVLASTVATHRLEPSVMADLAKVRDHTSKFCFDWLLDLREFLENIQQTPLVGGEGQVHIPLWALPQDVKDAAREAASQLARSVQATKYRSPTMVVCIPRSWDVVTKYQLELSRFWYEASWAELVRPLCDYYQGTYVGNPAGGLATDGSLTPLPNAPLPQPIPSPTPFTVTTLAGLDYQVMRFTNTGVDSVLFESTSLATNSNLRVLPLPYPITIRPGEMFQLPIGLAAEATGNLSETLYMSLVFSMSEMVPYSLTTSVDSRPIQRQPSRAMGSEFEMTVVSRPLTPCVIEESADGLAWLARTNYAAENGLLRFRTSLPPTQPMSLFRVRQAY